MKETINSNISYSKLTDEELAEACKNKDEFAFKELTKRYLNQIFNFSRQYTHSTEDTEDVVQDTFFKVWKHINKFTKGLKFKPWIYTIARNTALDFLKKRKASVFSDLDDTENDLAFADTLEDSQPLAPELFDNAALVDKLLIAMKSLHPDHQTVLILHYRENMTFDEIASATGKPMNTVKSWHRRAVIRLRGLLAENF